MDKHAVAQCFSAAASSYDQAAHLQRAVADRLLGYLSEVDIQAECVADLGTGTGYCLPWLAETFEPTRLIALDISADMLQAAAHREPLAELLLADLEAPVFASESLDLAVSSLAVQWLDEPRQFLERMIAALKPGGYLAFASLGPRTLYELKASWAAVDNQPHVNQFYPASSWADAVSATGFVPVLTQEQQIVISYEQPMLLLQELKALGANHVERECNARMGSVRAMLKAYQSFQLADCRYPATWDVYYLIVQKPYRQ